MKRTPILGLFAALLLAIGTVGCQQPDMSEMMKPPTRPAELDLLASFVGKWHGTWEMKVAGSDEVIKGDGVDVVKWDADKWVLVEQYEGGMGDEGHFSAVGVWTWDVKAGKFRYYGFDNMGNISTGTSKYDHQSGVWHMKSKGYHSPTGGRSVAEGTMKFVGDDTMEWEFTEWDSLKLRKLIEMKGVSHKQ